jgi:hypothetical protein
MNDRPGARAKRLIAMQWAACWLLLGDAARTALVSVGYVGGVVVHGQTGSMAAGAAATVLGSMLGAVAFVAAAVHVAQGDEAPRAWRTVGGAAAVGALWLVVQLATYVGTMGAAVAASLLASRSGADYSTLVAWNEVQQAVGAVDRGLGVISTLVGFGFVAWRALVAAPPSSIIDPARGE